MSVNDREGQNRKTHVTHLHLQVANGFVQLQQDNHVTNADEPPATRTRLLSGEHKPFTSTKLFFSFVFFLGGGSSVLVLNGTEPNPNPIALSCKQDIVSSSLLAWTNMMVVIK